MRDELPHIYRLAWPAILGQLAAMGMGVFDIVMVNPLGTDVVASVSLGHVWGVGGAVVAVGIARALDPLVSQAWGAQDRPAAGIALARNLLLMVPVCALTMAWFATAPWGLRLLDEPPHLIPMAARYCFALGISMVPALFLYTLRQFLSSCAIVRPVTVVLIAGLLLKVPLNYVMIGGWGPIPGWGAPGAAYATGIVESFMLLALLALQWRFFLEMWPVRGTRLVDFPALGRLLGIGLNLGVQMGTEFWAFGLVTVMAGWIGETALAAHTTAISIVSLVFMLPLGISTAVATRVGNLLGEQKAWQPAAAAAYTFGTGGAVVVILLFLLTPDWIVSTYNVTAEVRPIAVTIIGVGAAMHFFDAMQVITFGVLRGAGDVRVPTLANLFGYYAVGLPLAWWWGVHDGGGAAGLWWGLVVGQIALMAALAVRLRYTMARGGFRVAAA